MNKKEPRGSQSVLSFLVKDKYFKILKIFLEKPDSKFYVNQLKEMTEISPRILITELKVLEEKGFLKSEKIANALFYSLEKNEKIKTLEVLFK